uniref:Capsid assembly protein n=1 Tax=viral metagenome TaxID=1070528 RepID=A0A6H1ZU00_9ZZZZ
MQEAAEATVDVMALGNEGTPAPDDSQAAPAAPALSLPEGGTPAAPAAAPRPAAPAAPAAPTGTWRDGLAEDLRAAPSLQKFQSPDDLAKSYLQLQAKIGLAPVRVPGQNATPQEWEDYYKATGRPDSPEKYSLPAAPEGVPGDFTPFFQDAAHKAGLSGKQADQFYRIVTGAIAADQQAQAQHVNQTREEAARNLRNAWGEKYAENMAGANKMFDLAFGGVRGAKEAVQAVGLADNPAFIAAMHALSTKLSDDVLVGASATSFGALSPAEIDARIDAIMETEAYRNDSHPRHKAVIKEIADLIERQGGEAIGQHGISISGVF